VLTGRASDVAGPGERRTEIAANLAAVERRIRAACKAAGRDRDEVVLVAVTKTFPASDVAHLAALGVRDMGENRHQEAAPKFAACLAAGLTDLRWHFVGQLQTNKAGAVAAYADVVHSVDRVRLVAALERAAQAHGRTLAVLVQVDLESVASTAARGRAGVGPGDIEAVAAAVDQADSLVLGGIMGVAPLAGDPAEAFELLETAGRALRASYPHARMVSAGMSGDLEVAIAHGATHLRVGTALLGSRPLLG
jgi:pyridoxal phosphate enzyme (YggS family)